MRTMKYMPVHKQQSISRETMEVYAPLAHRLGIYTIKWELEDLAFRYMEPEIYYDLVEQVKVKRREREAMIHEAMAEIKEHLDEQHIKCKQRCRLLRHAGRCAQPVASDSGARKGLHCRAEIQYVPVAAHHRAVP